ncbi:hypothetical protein ACJJTC_001761 [Scirpophaga incertulas]
MIERKILLFVLFAIVYCMYSVHMWFTRSNGETNQASESRKVNPIKPTIEENLETQIQESKQPVKRQAIPLFINGACSIIQIFTEKPTNIIKIITAALDAFKVKEQERQNRKLNPNGERRQSLAEFANKKPLRRESSKFGLQLFQIAESIVSNDEEKKPRRQTRLYTRGESTNSYLSDRNTQNENSAPASISETASGEQKLVKRQSVAKLFGARPVPMVRRSSFPALPLNPDVQALMLGHRQASFDSDDEGDGKGRRVRIIRRY